LNIAPTGNNVVVKLNKAEELSKSGIILSAIHVDEKHGEGVVVAVGPGRTLDNGVHVPLTVKPNDRVFFAPHSGSEFRIEGEKFVMMPESEIFGVIE
jgi:chaperonin GroES